VCVKNPFTVLRLVCVRLAKTFNLRYHRRKLVLKSVFIEAEKGGDDVKFRTSPFGKYDRRVADEDIELLWT
jgi:hypothetical protein